MTLTGATIKAWPVRWWTRWYGATGARRGARCSIRAYASQSDIEALAEHPAGPVTVYARRQREAGSGVAAIRTG